VLKRNTPIHVIDGADLAAWKKATEPIYAKWIEERDKAGDKGADLVKAAETLVAKYSK
jgi:TRAP-type C4-dicarboxylate transport system substrate-binding protein